MMDFILSPGTQDNVKACCMVYKSCFLYWTWRKDVQSSGSRSELTTFPAQDQVA